MPRRRRTRAGFTLVELLVVIGIIAILAGLLMPAVMRALTTAHENAVVNLIHQCDVAATAFRNDHGDIPPSTYDEMFAMFKYDSNGNGVYEPGVDDVNFWDPPAVGTPGYENEGIEVFLACVSTQDGGTYLEPAAKQLGNTDADLDVGGIVASVVNWPFKSTDLFELVDWWDNPLVYVTNRHYDEHDGLVGGIGETVRYRSAEQQVILALSRTGDGFKTGNPPNLTGFQMYSIGSDGVENLNYSVPDDWYFLNPNWRTSGRILANWEE